MQREWVRAGDPEPGEGAVVVQVVGNGRQADGPEQGGVLFERLRPAGVLDPRAEDQGLVDEVSQGRRKVPGPAAEDAGQDLVVLLQPDGGPRVALEQQAVADHDPDVFGSLDQPAEGEPLAGRDALHDGQRRDVGVAELVAPPGPPQAELPQPGVRVLVRQKGGHSDTSWDVGPSVESNSPAGRPQSPLGG